METLASFAGLHLTSIRAIERGAAPNVANLIAIASALGTTVGDLLGEDSGVTATLDRALPGWSRLTPTQQARIRETVADLAAVRPLEIAPPPATVPPEQLEATRAGREFQARADRLRRAAENSGDTNAGKAKPTAPRRRGSGPAAPR